MRVLDGAARLKGKPMETENRIFLADRAGALALSVAVTFLVFAAINAGFTPHGTELAGRELPAATTGL